MGDVWGSGANHGEGVGGVIGKKEPSTLILEDAEKVSVPGEA